MVFITVPPVPIAILPAPILFPPPAPLEKIELEIQAAPIPFPPPPQLKRLNLKSKNESEDLSHKREVCLFLIIVQIHLKDKIWYFVTVTFLSIAFSQFTTDNRPSMLQSTKFY